MPKPISDLNWQAANLPVSATKNLKSELFPSESASSQPDPSVTSDHGESDQDQEDVSEDISTVVGVSIGKEQTRLTSPMTPTAEKIAAMDDNGERGFFEGNTGDEEDHVTPASSQISVLESILVETVAEPAEESHEPALPPPWSASPKIFQTHKPSKAHDSPITRSRSSTASTGILVDLNIKRFLSTFSLPALTEQNPFKDLSLPRLPSALRGQKDVTNETGTLRNRRSNSAFLPSFTWGNIVQGKRSSRDASPEPRSFKYERAETLGNRPEERQAPPRTQFTEDCQQGTPQLRRTASGRSLLLSSSLSKMSSLGDDSRWENVQGQVNSRVKAIVDSYQDSTIKLPSLPSINLSALRPDFTHRHSSSDPKRTIQSEDNEGNNRTHSRMESLKLDDHLPGGHTQSKHFKRSPKAVYHYLDHALDNLTGDLIILGGYRGSVLRSAESPHRQVWVPVKVGLNIRKVNLEVGLKAEDEENMESSIVPSGMLTHIGPVDISRRLIKRLRSCKNAQEGNLRIHDYGYDWRLSPHLLSRKLIQYLELLRCNKAETPKDHRGATVIAHSLGGLLTRHAVNQRPELFKGVIYAGVPQYCVNILGENY